MLRTRIIKYSEPVLTVLFYTVIFFFFTFCYNNHLHFLEQSQLLLLTCDALLNKISLPGGISGYIGEFLTQFYYYSLAGSVIITLLLYLIQIISRKIIAAANPDKNLFPLSFMPSLIAAILLCDEYYPLSGITGYLLSLTAALFYILISGKTHRFLSGLLLIPSTFWIAGGSYSVLISVILIYEIIVLPKSKQTGSSNKYTVPNNTHPLKFHELMIYLILGILFPLIIRRTIIFQPLNLAYLSEFYYDLRTLIPTGIIVLFTVLPVILIVAFYANRVEQKKHIMVYITIAILFFTGYTGVKMVVNFDAEDIYKYDHLARNKRWKEIISLAEKHPPRNDLSLSMLNLALAKTGKIGYEMFRYEQNGDEGLFLTSAWNYFSLIHRSEIFYHLGLLNASHESAFESMETTTNLKKPVRAIKRLAEINLLNGHYEVARKYIKMLHQTVFYRKWAVETEKYLYNYDLMDNHPEWAEIRKHKLSIDYFFKAQNIQSIIEMLQLSLNEHPDRIVFEYLMAHFLLNKDLMNIIHFLPAMDKISYREIPLNYQEALLYISNIAPDGGNPEIQNKISEFTRQKMNEYLYAYSTNRDPKEYLKRRFDKTYWYYFDFKDIKISN